MNRLALTGALLALLISAAPRFALASDADVMREARDRAEIDALLHRLEAAASAQDVDAFLRQFTLGPDFAFAFNGWFATDPASVREKHLDAWWRSIQVTYRASEPHIAFLGPGAAVLSAAGESRQLLLTGQSQSGTFVITLALRRTEEGWRVVQCHESTSAP